MRDVAFLENAGVTSGVGYQAEAVAKALGPYSHLIFNRYLLDGQNRTLWRNSQPLFTLRAWPRPFSAKSVAWIRLGRRWHTYGEKHHTQAIWHATNQTLSFILKGHQPSVVTVHDIIELLEPQTWAGRSLARYLYSGIPHVDRIIAVSNYTAKTITEYFNIPEDKITVIHNGVGDDFAPIPDFENSVGYQTLLHELKLTPSQPIVLYVGSEHLRKNLSTAIRAFAQVHRQLPTAVFLKIGEPGILSGRAELLNEIDHFNLRDHVKIVSSVSASRLNEIYNLADVFIYPSRFEGFGLPPLQAMACGTPVVVSNATSLSEVVGQAGKLRDCDDVDGFAQDSIEILQNKDVAANLRQQGLERARQFTWDIAAQKLHTVYNSLE